MRDVSHSDLPALTAIKGPDSEMVHRDRLRDTREPGFRYLVLVLDQQPIGVACLVLRRPSSWPDAGDPRHVPQIVDLEVHEGYRGRGYGSAFLRAMEHLVVAAGYGHLFLAVDPVDNPRAYALYQRLGYQALQSEPYRSHWEFTDWPAAPTLRRYRRGGKANARHFASAPRLSGWFFCYIHTPS